MSKQLIIDQIIVRLDEDRLITAASLQAAHEAATHEESKAENKYDTRGLEAAYLADGQRRRLHEIETALAAYRALPCLAAAPEVRVGALVLLQGTEGSLRVFLGPDAAGMKLSASCGEVLVITPRAPIGKALLGNAVGDEITVLVSGHSRTYELVDIQ
jgi:transcription elongation GreA/GreB family factor